METGVRYPATSNIFNNFTRVKVFSRDAEGTQVYFKLIATPNDDDDMWTSLGEIAHNTQEFDMPPDHNYGAGINFRCEEVGQKVNTLLIKKFTVFYIPGTSRSVNTK